LAAGVGQMPATAMCWQNWLITMRKVTVANNMEQRHNGHMCMLNHATKRLKKEKLNQRNRDEKMPQDLADELSWWSAFATCAYGTLSSDLAVAK
jgi:hypothetical protein